MTDYREEVTEGFGSRLMDSIKGVAFGIVLFLGSFGVLWLNEGRAVKTARAQEEGAGAVISLSSPKVEAANQDKLVHLSGPAKAQGMLGDPVFGVTSNGVKLSREVEVYQWRENKSTKTEKNLGGSQTKKTEYNYTREWSKSHISSKNFKVAEGHHNPKPVYQSQSFTAEKVTIGDFQLGKGLISDIRGGSPVRLQQVPKNLSKPAMLVDGYLYLGLDPAKPAVGDMRVRFTAIDTPTVSVIAKQSGNSLQPWSAKNGRNLEILHMGSVDASAMFQSAMKSNSIFTWILRLVGFLMMFIGLSMVFKPIETFADIIPFLGDLMGAGIAVFSLVVAGMLSLVVISAAWLAYRPMLGGGLLAGGVLLILGAKMGMPKRHIATA